MKLKWTSFRVAFAGIAFLLRTQVHTRWHLMATLFVIVAGIIVGLSRAEWLALTSAMALVWVAECLNTAIEQTCDAITREQRPQIRYAKDAAAGAVLLASIFAVVIGLLVFVPHL